MHLGKFRVPSEIYFSYVISFVNFQLTSKQNEPDFKGPEDVLPRSKEQKKIQIEIRRSISSKRARTTSPVRRSIRDPENTVQITRSSNEGKSPLFDRDEIKHFVKKDSEQRVVAIIPGMNEKCSILLEDFLKIVYYKYGLKN